MKAVAPIGSEQSRETVDAFRLAVDTTPAFIHTGRPDGYLDYFNRGWLDFLGKSLEDVCGWRWTESIHPEDVAGIVQKWHAALESGEPFEAEARVQRADGEYRMFLHRKVPLRGEDGAIVKWFGSSIDIEDQKRAEERIAQKTRELQRSELCLQQGESLYNSGSWSFLPSGEFEYLSPQLYSIFEFDPAKRLPMLSDYVKLVHPEDRPLVQGILDEMIAKGIGCDVKKRIVRTDGTLRLMRGVGSRVMEQGKAVRLVGTLMDITEQERTTRELWRREAYLAQAQALSHTGSFGLNLSTGELVWSDETFRILNYKRTVKPTLDLVFKRVHPDDAASVQQAIDDAKEGKSLDFGHRLLMPDGSVKHVHVIAHPLKSAPGDLELVGSVMDVTVRQKAFEGIKLLRDELQEENILMRDEIGKTSMFEEVVGNSPVLQTVLARAAKVAPTDSNVLITGDTGTGKELIVRAIHKRSKRSERPFVSLSCAAIPSSLIMSELFGHEKGAFTGAVQRRAGRFELAEGGTLFLDEVGDLPLETQIALLRVLQEREFERVGGTEVLRCHVRVIAATNRDLQSLIADGTFRSDLYYRLNVFPIRLPPLRERKEDIPLLVNYFVDHYAKRAGKQIKHIPKKALETLQEYSWPGNVRQLQNVIERSLIINDTDKFSIDKSWVVNKLRPTASSGPVGYKAIERERIKAALAQSKGKISGPSGAAAKLGMPATTLESKIRALKINKYSFKAI